MKHYSMKTGTNFNPHHREGGDDYIMDFISSKLISIHTTAKVVTIHLCCGAESQAISIHTTAKVVTRCIRQSGV